MTTIPSLVAPLASVSNSPADDAKGPDADTFASLMAALFAGQLAPVSDDAPADGAEAPMSAVTDATSGDPLGVPAPQPGLAGAIGPACATADPAAATGLAAGPVSPATPNGPIAPTGEASTDVITTMPHSAPHPATGATGGDQVSADPMESTAATRASEPVTVAAATPAPGRGQSDQAVNAVESPHDGNAEVATSTARATDPTASQVRLRRAPTADQAMQDGAVAGTTGKEVPSSSATSPVATSPAEAAVIDPSGELPTPGALIATSTPATPAPTASSITSAAPPPSPAASPDPGQQVFRVLAPLRGASDGSYQLSLEMHPAELGAVTLRIHMSGGEMSLHVAAAPGAAQDALRAALPQLRTELETHGVHTGSFEVGDRPSDAGGDRTHSAPGRRR